MLVGLCERASKRARVVVCVHARKQVIERVEKEIASMCSCVRACVCVLLCVAVGSSVCCNV